MLPTSTHTTPRALHAHAPAHAHTHTLTNAARPRPPTLARSLVAELLIKQPVSQPSCLVQPLRAIAFHFHALISQLGRHSRSSATRATNVQQPIPRRERIVAAQSQSQSECCSSAGRHFCESPRVMIAASYRPASPLLLGHACVTNPSKFSCMPDKGPAVLTAQWLVRSRKKRNGALPKVL